MKGFLRRLGWLVRRRKREAELDEEIRFHLEADTEDLSALHLDPAEAERRARRQFGNVTLLREETRTVWGGVFVLQLVQDLRYAVRILSKSPMFTATVVLTLALGIGAVSAIFSVTNAAMFRPLPFPDSDRLVLITDSTGPAGTPDRLSLDAWEAESQLLESIAGGVRPRNVGVMEETADGNTFRLGMTYLDTMSLLGTRPLLGRWYEPDEAMVGPFASTIVISYGAWQRYFGGDEDVIGRPLPGWSRPWGRTVIGVMPQGFYVTPDGADLDGWYGLDRVRTPPVTRIPAYARLKPGVSPELAQAELAGISRSLANEADPDGSERIINVEPLRDALSQLYSRTLIAWLVGVALVLLIGCVNVVNLQLSRAVPRETEMRTRAALGAGRVRLFRQLLVENVLLALAGGVVGLVIAFIGIRVFVLLAPTFYKPTNEIELDAAVLVFTLGVSLTVAVLSGFFPALLASRSDLRGMFQAGSRIAASVRQRWLRRLPIVTEVALALVLLVSTGVLFNSYLRLLDEDLGFDQDGLLYMDIDIMGKEPYFIEHDYLTHAEITPEHDRFFEETLTRLASLPDVEMVGMASWVPPGGRVSRPVTAVGRPQVGQDQAELLEISPDFFRTMGIPMVEGRPFADHDTASAPPVAILNQTAADWLFGGINPIGEFVQITMNAANSALADDPIREVVGVVADIRSGQWDTEAWSMVYIPYLQHLREYSGTIATSQVSFKSFVMRTSRTDPASLEPSVRAAVAEVDPDVTAAHMMPLAQRISAPRTTELAFAQISGTFTGLAVLIVAVGLYGLIAYSVAQRRREFGIRTALGAQRADILRTVLGECIAVAGAGVVVGLSGLFVLTRVVGSLLPLHEVTPMDPLTLAVVTAGLVAIALGAGFIPAWRAARQNPVISLRTE